MGGDAADTSSDIDCGAVGGAARAGGARVYRRVAGVRDGVLPRASHGRSGDELCAHGAGPWRTDRNMPVHGARAGLRIELPGAAISVERERKAAGDDSKTDDSHSDDDFGFCRILPSSV